MVRIGAKLCPAHQDLVVPQAQLAAPQVAAFLDRPAAGGGLDLDQLAVLVEVDRLGSDVFDAASGGLPAGPPVAGEADAVAGCFGAYSGLRPSELTALRVARLDLLRGTVRVVEAATEVDGHLHWGPVKTHEARTVRIPRSICEELGTQLAGRPHGRDDLAFPAPLGGPMRWGKWTRRYFKPAAVRAGLFVTREVDPKTGQVVVSSALRLYDLRHTCASLLIAQGASVKAVQAQLGHATASITLDTYGHLFPSELEALADRLEQVRTAALASRERTQRGPSVVNLAETAGG